MEKSNNAIILFHVAFLGSLSCLLCEILSHKSVTIWGGLLAFVGMMTSSLANSVPYLFIRYANRSYFHIWSHASWVPKRSHIERQKIITKNDLVFLFSATGLWWDLAQVYVIRPVCCLSTSISTSTEDSPPACRWSEPPSARSHCPRTSSSWPRHTATGIYACTIALLHCRSGKIIRLQ